MSGRRNSLGPWLEGLGVVVLVSPRKPGPWGDPSWFGRMDVGGCRGSRLVVQVVKGLGRGEDGS